MLDFAVKVSASAHLVGEADFAALKAHDFDEEDIWDIAAISAFWHVQPAGQCDQHAAKCRVLRTGPLSAAHITLVAWLHGLAVLLTSVCARLAKCVA